MRKIMWKQVANLTRFTLLAGAVAAVSVGCGDDEGGEFGAELEGIYKVTSMTETEQSCELEGDPVAEGRAPKYFKLSSQSWFGQTFVGYTDCDNLDECEQSDSVSLTRWMFSAKRGDHWGGDPLTSASWGSADSDGMVSCSLNIVWNKAFLDGSTVRMEARSARDIIEVPEDDCSAELAKSHLADATCQNYLVLTGTRDF